MGFTDQNLANFIPEVWSKKLEVIFDNKCVMKPLVSRKYEPDASFGDTIHVQRVGDFTIQDYVRNQVMEMEQSTVTDDTLLINQQKYHYFGVDRLDKRQSLVSIMPEYVERQGVAIAETIDARLLSHYTDALAANVLGSTTAPETINASNVYDIFVEMGERLDNQNVFDGDRNAVIVPAVRSAILKSDQLTKRGTVMVDETIKNGKIGTFAGFNLHITTNMSQVSGTYPIMFFQKEFIQYVEQYSQLVGEQPDGTFVDAMKMIKLYGSKVFNPECGAVVYAAA